MGTEGLCEGEGDSFSSVSRFVLDQVHSINIFD